MRAIFFWLAGLALLALAACDSPPPSPTPVVPTPTATITPAVTTVSVTPTPLPPTATSLPETIPASPTAKPLSIPTPTSIPQPVPGAFVDITFVDSQHGWWLGESCVSYEDCPVAVTATTDGGETWQVVSVPPAEHKSSSHATLPGVQHILFATPLDGWLFDPSLLTTHDGGKTWTNTDLKDSDITALVAKDGTAWATSNFCTPAGQCNAALILSKDAGRTWQSAPGRPVIGFDQQQIIAFTAEDVWVYSASDNSHQVEIPSILATHDGGKTWQDLAVPAPSTTDCRVAGAGHQQLWLLCSGQAWHGQQEKTLYISPDGGHHWNKASDSTNLSQDGYAWSFAVNSLNHGWIVANAYVWDSGVQYDWLDASNDGGHSWYHAFDMDKAGGGDGPILFADDLHGWLVARNNAGSKLFRTRDGGNSWEEVTYPGPITP